MSYKLSPGVYLFEEDRSQVISSENQQILATVGAFKKGPLKPTRISNRSELYNRYTTGKITREFGYGTYSVYNALENAKNILVKRVVKDAMYAGLSVIQASNTDTHNVPFLVGSSTDYEQGAKDMKTISISSGLPNGYGLSVIMKNDLDETEEGQVEIVSQYNATMNSNEMLAAFAKLIQDQYDKWGVNGKAQVVKTWPGNPKQEIHTVKISRDMIVGESIKLTITDLILGSKTITVDYVTDMRTTLDELRKAINGTNYVFAYVSDYAERTIVISALNAGPNRLTLEAEFTEVAEDTLEFEDVITQKGHGIYDDTTIALCDPDNIPVSFEELQVVALPIDDATIYNTVAGYVVSGDILREDIDTILAVIEPQKPIQSMEQLVSIIDEWVVANPYLASVSIVDDLGAEVITPKVGDVLNLKAMLSNGEQATTGLTIQWSDADDTKDFGSGSSLTLTDAHLGYKIKVAVNGYRQELSYTIDNVVVEA